jgi:hypothetical protein
MFTTFLATLLATLAIYGTFLIIYLAEGGLA